MMHVALWRPSRVLVPLLVVTAGVLTLSAPVAGGATSAGESLAGSDDARYQTASLRFVESAPGRPSGYRVRIDYTNPDDPEAKPPSVRKVVEVFPPGTRIDTGAPARCTASDAELMLVGVSACPSGAVVGTGFIRLDTGAAGPGRYLREDVVFLNNTEQLIYLTTDRATGARTVVRAQVHGRRVITEAPLLPGAAPDGTAIDVARGYFPRLVRMRDGARRAYVTTPGHCPARGHWTTKVRFDYHDGTTQSEATRNRCDH
jgi:hypothetical protein